MLDEIKSLPPLPASIIRIQELCMNSETDINELSRVIESDPMLSANILKSANSPLYGMSKEISSIQQAVMLFGISMIRGFAAANAIKKMVAIDLSPYGISAEDISRLSTLQSSFVREWYRNVDKSMLPLLQSVAFLMELGKLMTAKKLISLGVSERFYAESHGDLSLDEVEKAYLGMSSYECAAMMFEHWNFEAALIEALREISNEDTRNPYAQVLNVVTKIAGVRGQFSEKALMDGREALTAFGLNSNAFEEAIISVKANAKRG